MCPYAYTLHRCVCSKRVQRNRNIRVASNATHTRIAARPLNRADQSLRMVNEIPLANWGHLLILRVWRNSNYNNESIIISIHSFKTNSNCMIIVYGTEWIHLSNHSNGRIHTICVRTIHDIEYTLNAYSLCSDISSIMFVAYTSLLNRQVHLLRFIVSQAHQAQHHIESRSLFVCHFKYKLHLFRFIR